MRLESRARPAAVPDRQALLRTIEALEGQRDTLGDAAIELAIAPLRARLAEGDAPAASASVDRSAERKIVTVMFVDVAGFTSLSERIGSEATLDMVNSLFDFLVPVIERHGGAVDKFIGDEIMAVFGAPRSVERHAEHALRAALAMFDALKDYNRARKLDVALHAGVNTGEVVAGAVGSAGRRDYSVTGDTVNVAARLEGAATGGQIVVGPTTYRQTSHLFEFQALEPLELKGKSHRLAAYRLIGVASRRTRARTEGLQLPFSGREPELDGLLSRFRDDAGARGAVAVRADPGLGKSRLVSELHDRLGRHVRWFEASAQDYRSDLSFGVVSELVDDIVGVVDGTERDVAAAAYADFVRDVQGERALRSLPYLLWLRGLPLDANDDREVSALGADALRQRIALALRELLLAATSGEPSIVCIEDMHWADPSSVALLRTLAEDSALASVLFVFTTRPDRSAASAWIEALDGNDRVVDLSPLSDTDSRALLSSAFADGSSPALVEEIGGKAQGNPLFLASFLRSLIDSGLATLARGRVAVDAPLDVLSIPDTVQAVVGSQIDRLPAPAKETLHWAAILGPTFSPHDVAQMAREERTDVDIESALGLLRARQLVTADAEDRLRFVHAIVRDVGYEQMLGRERRRLHGVAARILGERVNRAEPSEADVALLAWHFERAGEQVQASARYEQAATMAAEAHAHSEELRYVDAAIRLADAADLLRIARLGERAGDALQILGRYAEAEERFRSLVASTEGWPPLDLARLHRKIARACTPRFQFEPVHRALDDARRSLAVSSQRNEEPWWREHFAVELFALWAYYMQGRTDACEAIAAALEPRLADHATMLERSQFHRGVGLMRLRQQRYRPDQSILEVAALAVKELREAGDSTDACLTMFGVPFTLLWSGAVREAERELQDVLRATVRLGDAERNLLCLVYLAVAYRQLDDVDSAEAFARAAIARAQANRSPHYEAISHGTLGWVAWRRGDGQGADDAVARAQAATVPNYPFAWIYCAVGLVRALERGQLEEAVSMLKRMLDPTHQRLDDDVHAVFDAAAQAPGDEAMDRVVATCRRIRYL